MVLPAGAMAGGKVVMPDKSERPYILTPDEVMSKEERTARQAEVITNCIKGFSKQRIERALKNEGATYVRFFNNDGALGYRPDDSYFKDKDVYAGKLNGHKLELNAMYDVNEAVKKWKDENSLLFYSLFYSETFEGLIKNRYVPSED